MHIKVNKIIQLNTYEFNGLTGSESHAIQQRQKRNQPNKWVVHLKKKQYEQTDLKRLLWPHYFGENWSCLDCLLV